jgi:hypothetical protein
MRGLGIEIIIGGLTVDVVVGDEGKSMKVLIDVISLLPFR